MNAKNTIEMMSSYSFDSRVSRLAARAVSPFHHFIIPPFFVKSVIFQISFSSERTHTQEYHPFVQHGSE